MNASTQHNPSPRGCVLVIGRSPSVLTETVALLHDKGYTAAATNQFDRVLGDYDMADYDIVVFGGMVPPADKERLRSDIAAQNQDIVFVQGLAGIPGVIAAQVDESTGERSSGTVVEYDPTTRSVAVRLDRSAMVTVSAYWATSFTPPEPTSTSMTVFDDELAAGSHLLPLPDEVPARASFAAVAIGADAWAFTVGAMPAGLTPGMLTEPPRALST